MLVEVCLHDGYKVRKHRTSFETVLMDSQYNFIAVRFATKCDTVGIVIDNDSGLGVDNIHR